MLTCKQLCKKKATHSIKLCVQKTVSREGTVTVPPKHTQTHTNTTVESRLPLNYSTSFYSDTNKCVQKAILGILRPLFWSLLIFCNFSGGWYLCQMLWLVSAVILASRHQPMLLIPFVNASYCVQEPVRMLYRTKDTEASKSNLKFNHHGNNSLLW